MESQATKNERSYYLSESLLADFSLAYRTAEGAMGLLRFMGCSGNPRRLKIRYQIIEKKEPVEERLSHPYSDTEYIVSAEPAPDRIGDKETIQVFNLDVSHMSGWHVRGDKFKDLLKTALMNSGDIYYYFDEQDNCGKAVFLRQEPWNRPVEHAGSGIPTVALTNLPLEVAVATIDGREYLVRFSDPKAPRTGSMVGPLRGNPADLRKQCLVRTVCTNDGTFTLDPFEGDVFDAIADQILTNSSYRVFDGIFCAVYDGVDKITAYCHYDDAVSRYAFGDGKLAKSLTLERIEKNQWQITDGRIDRSAVVASPGKIRSMAEKPEYQVKRFE